MKHMIAFLLALVLCGAAWALEPEHTGAWYDPDNSGHGISLYVWDGGSVFWWFTYEVTGSTFLMSDVSNTGEYVLLWPQSHEFPVSHSVSMYEAGTATLSESGDSLILQWNVLLSCGVTFSPVPPWCNRFADSQGSAILTRLTPQ